MGVYVNPSDMEKEAWVKIHGTPTSSDQLRSFSWDGPDLPLCLVDNGPFTALGVAIDREELEAFCENRTGRPKWFYLAPREEILKVIPPMYAKFVQSK
jgi:hypothetical protein